VINKGVLEWIFLAALFFAFVCNISIWCNNFTNGIFFIGATDFFSTNASAIAILRVWIAAFIALIWVVFWAMEETFIAGLGNTFWVFEDIN